MPAIAVQEEGQTGGLAENIDLPLSYKDIPKSERQALVADTLDRFNIVGKKEWF